MSLIPFKTNRTEMAACTGPISLIMIRIPASPQALLHAHSGQ